jgi:hypothetical protein
MPTYAHQVWLNTPAGYRQALVGDYLSLSYSLDAREGGGFSLELPHNFDPALLVEGAQVEVWQSVNGRAFSWEGSFIALHRPWAQARRGTQFKTISGPSMTGHVVAKNSRVIAALEADAAASRTDSADDVVKYFVRQTVGEAAVSGASSAGRDLASVYGLTVEADQGRAPSITVNGFCRPLADVLAECRKKSEEDLLNPRRLYWRLLMSDVNPARYRFATYVDLMGVNHGQTSAQPVYISPEFGTATEVEWDRDRTDEFNSVFVRYDSGNKTTRLTDTSRSRAFGGAFREAFFDASSYATETEGLAAGRRKLAEGKPRNVMRINVADTEAVQYGVHYRLGDRVAVRFLGETFDMDVLAVDIQVGRDGRKMTVKLEEV